VSKEYNRRQDERALVKATRIVKSWFRHVECKENDIETRANRIKKNRAKCSCHMCRNPRTSKFTKGKERLTIQERKNKTND
jgi:hypothetical protein